MIKVSVLYPNKAGVRFDLSYYCNEHMAIVRECLGAACKGIAVDAAISSDPLQPYCAIGHLFFDSVEAFQQAFAPHAERIMGDLLNFTDSQPLVQISDVLMAP
jgi:uncharacterized protein (TIGR02118 family)